MSCLGPVVPRGRPLWLRRRMLRQPPARPTLNAEPWQGARGFLAPWGRAQGNPSCPPPWRGFPCRLQHRKNRGQLQPRAAPGLPASRGQGRQQRKGGSGMKTPTCLQQSVKQHLSACKRGDQGISCRLPHVLPGDFQAPRGGLVGRRGKVCSKGWQGRRGGGHERSQCHIQPPRGCSGLGSQWLPAPWGRARCLPACCCLQDVVCSARGRAAAGARRSACAAPACIQPPSIPPLRLTPSPSLPRCLGHGELRGGVSAGFPGGLDPVPHQILRGLVLAIVPFPCAAASPSPHCRATPAQRGRRPQDLPRMRPPFHQPRFTAETPAPPIPKPRGGCICVCVCVSFPPRVTSRAVSRWLHPLILPSPHFWPDPQHVPPAPQMS